MRLAIGGILISREIERVADYSKSISRFFSSYHPNQQQVDMIVELFELVVEMLDAFSHLFSNPEINTNKITDLEVKISNKFKEFYAILIEYLKQAKTTKEVEKIIAVMKQIINLERAGDHLINVQEIVTFIKTGKFIELKEYN
ncbi:Phosphate transport system protein PhoU [Mycoplasma putrefaciens]|nr:Phosphate transport system protein PhoU [Mycoplasma putrefaciens]